jgi:hypothetical protein
MDDVLIVNSCSKCGVIAWSGYRRAGDPPEYRLCTECHHERDEDDLRDHIVALTAKLAAAEQRAERAGLLPALVEAGNAMATLLEMDDDMTAYVAAEVWKQLAAGLAPADEPAGPGEGDRA